MPLFRRRYSTTAAAKQKSEAIDQELKRSVGSGGMVRGHPAHFTPTVKILILGGFPWSWFTRVMGTVDRSPSIFKLTNTSTSFSVVVFFGVRVDVLLKWFADQSSSLGPSESGKSTFVKHLRAVHDREKLGAERESFKRAILLILLRLIKAITSTFDGPHQLLLQPLVALIKPLQDQMGCVVDDPIDVDRLDDLRQTSTYPSSGSAPQSQSDCSDSISVISNRTAVAGMGFRPFASLDDEKEELSPVYCPSSPFSRHTQDDLYSICDSESEHSWW